MAHSTVVCLITPYATTSRISEEELANNVLYSQLITSVGSMLPDVEIYNPTLQYSALPDSFVTHNTVKKDLLYKHSKESVDNTYYGWRSSMGLQKKADQVWFGADCGLVPPQGWKNKNVSIKNIELLTDNEFYIDFIRDMTRDMHYAEGTIDLVKTVLNSQGGEIKFITL